jgi:hypothetical protein
MKLYNLPASNPRIDICGFEHILNNIIKLYL